MMILAMCVAFAIGSLVCYMAVYAGAKADRENEEYWKEMGETSNDSKTNITEQSKTADSITNFNPNQIYHNYGWICPVCGRGLSPYTSVCPCRGQLDMNWYITCGNQYKYNL